LDVIGELDERRVTAADDQGIADLPAHSGDPETDAQVRGALGARLYGEVAAMNLDNFVVRLHRRAVEKYAKRRRNVLICSFSICNSRTFAQNRPTCDYKIK
jgi:type I restriction enzyme R subunit